MIPIRLCFGRGISWESYNLYYLLPVPAVNLASRSQEAPWTVKTCSWLPVWHWMIFSTPPGTLPRVPEYESKVEPVSSKWKSHLSVPSFPVSSHSTPSSPCLTVQTHQALECILHICCAGNQLAHSWPAWERAWCFGSVLKVFKSVSFTLVQFALMLKAFLKEFPPWSSPEKHPPPRPGSLVIEVGHTQGKSK